MYQSDCSLAAFFNACPFNISAGHVLIPASWHRDEPLVEVVAAAAAMPDLKFVITGNPVAAIKEQIQPLPSNVSLSGFVSDAEYA